jgi:modification methylase
MLQRDEMDAWMRAVWSDIRGASLREGHPAPFPVEIAERLIRMFSFAGDTVLDPFAGSGSTAVAAIRTGRNSILVEIEEEYLNSAVRRGVAEAAKQQKQCHTAIVDIATKEDFAKNVCRTLEGSPSERLRNQAASHTGLPM